MELKAIESRLPKRLYEILEKEITSLRPAQEKAVNSGLFEGKNLLVCTPTASGKTLIAELAAIKAVIENKGKAVYVVPLRSLANEKFRDFKKRYSGVAKVALSIGDIDSSDPYLADYDLVVCTAEKLDSLIRHKSPFLRLITILVIDEVHMLNDPGRGPTLEILITIMREMLKNIQIIALSATIGNPEELAEWLNAKLVVDDWRPVALHKGVLHQGKIEF